MLHKESNKGKEILIIEPNFLLGDTLKEILTLEGFVIHFAVDGSTGLAFAKNYIPNLLICARTFSSTNCFKILKALKADKATRSIPFIFLSCNPSSEEHLEMSKQKDVIIINKPFPIKLLIDTIHSYLFRLPYNHTIPSLLNPPIQQSSLRAY